MEDNQTIIFPIPYVQFAHLFSPTFIVKSLTINFQLCDTHSKLQYLLRIAQTYIHINTLTNKIAEILLLREVVLNLVSSMNNFLIETLSNTNIVVDLFQNKQKTEINSIS